METATKIKVIVREAKNKEGGTFKTYKYVLEGSGALVDLRFKKGNNLSEIDACKKCWVTLESLSDASARFEYPRFYADGIIAVEKIC